ncbi:MAG: MaoC family dehydratase [Proteobacteria bacterium]|nr:MaoC family dehydratase [Pseudomonadota bacterium]
MSVGEELPKLDIPITVRRIVSAAIATRDYENVHHDKDETQALGSPHIFMNILTSNGVVERYVTEWAGPEAVFRKVAIKLGAPNYPGDTMTMSARITAKGEAGPGSVTLEVAGRNSLGPHITGTVVLVLPQ